MDRGELLAGLRREKGLSQEELAKELHISRQTVSRWETGTSVPSTENLIYLSRIYGMSLDELVNNGTDSPENEQTERAEQTERTERRSSIGKAGMRAILAGEILAICLAAAAILLCVHILNGNRRDAKPKGNPTKISDMEREEVRAEEEESHFTIGW